jgi:hypothetical protein
MNVIDHTDSQWLSRYNRHSRTNGAFTYSQDICKWHLPIWRQFLGPNDIIATCGKFPDATVQYLHERSHVDLSSRTKLFVTTYRDLADTLGDRGLWLPNTIDREILPDHFPEKEWVYYGNIIGHKRTAFDRLTQLKFDVVAGVKNQSEALRRVAQYRYGIGVGRCALEMMALGLKVLIFGKDFGGILLSEDDFRRQQAANFNGNVITGAASIDEAIERIDESLPVSATFQQTMPEIERRIVDAWRRVAA